MRPVKKHAAVTLINFGSNIDLENAYYTKQLAALETGFPSLLKFTGNILACSNESIRGLNKPQAYGKTSRGEQRAGLHEPQHWHRRLII